jgi:sarcosine oxidase
MKKHEIMVIGVGGMGSAACVELARRGVSVLGIEQFRLGHGLGSSHGESRIIRKAYFEHPDYVPLLHRAYELWNKLENDTGRTLLRPTGLVLSGSVDGETIRGARLSAKQHGLELQNFTASEALRRFPGLVFPEDHDVAFEPGAGTLLVDDCVQAQIDEAIRLGATIVDNEKVIDWSSDGQSVSVRTTNNEYHATSLIITAGAWALECLRSLDLPLQVVRKFVGWFPCQSINLHENRGFPTFYFELPHGTFYGFPSFDGTTVKVAEHSGGESVDDPLTVDRECYTSDFDRLNSFLTRCLPEVKPDPVRHSICLYTRTPDQHFVIDHHPVWKNVAFAAGFSGHGFKFCPVVGEVLADLIQQGESSLPIEFLSRKRSSLIV